MASVKWYRSYDKNLKTSLRSGRPIVYDPSHCQPYFQDDKWNYWSLFEQAADDIILLEWDIAVSRDDRRRFEMYCHATPDRVHVAPYEHYFVRSVHADHSYLHRFTGASFIKEFEPFCFYFGFGMVYIPLAMIKQFMQDSKAKKEITTEFGKSFRLGDMIKDDSRTSVNFVDDCIFSWWHASTYDMRPVTVHWDVRPVHLHYDANPSTLGV
jgi:hypothetical protein